MSGGELSYDRFARGAARLSARLARLDVGDDEQQHEAAAATTNNNTTNKNSSRWRWVERRAPLTGARVGLLELERWLPAAAAAAEEGVEEEAAAVQQEDDEAAVKTNPYPNHQNHHRYLFHAAHSAVYRVPVLCFRAERADGAPLPPGQVRADLSPWLEAHGPPEGLEGEDAQQHEEEVEEAEERRNGGAGAEEGGSGSAAARRLTDPSWDFYLARGEHPAGAVPGLTAPGHVYYLHPCRSAARMALLMRGGDDDEDDDDGNEDDDEAASRYLAAWLSAVAPAVGLPRPPQPEERAAETTRRRRDGG